MDFYDPSTSVPKCREWKMVLKGTGATAPTVTVGHGFAVTYTAVGRYLITFKDNPGTFAGIGGHGFRDPTQANVKGWTLTAGAYPNAASTYTLEIDLWNSAFAAVDLATTSFLDLTLNFSELKTLT